MIDERNIENIIGLIESSNQKIKTIKETLEEQKTAFELPKNDFRSLASSIDEAVKSKKFENIQAVFENLSQNVAFKTDFLKEQFKNLDANLLKVQNIAKNIDKDISSDVNILVEIVETFSYKIKIIQGIVSDISGKIDAFNGENPEKFLRSLRSDCSDFDEEFDQLLRELKQNFKKAGDITAKLSKLDTGVDISKELFSINIAVNAIMTSLSIFDEKYKDLGKAFEESGLYTDFSSKIEDLSYNTKHLIRNIDNFNQIVSNGDEIKAQIVVLEEKIGSINSLIETMNQDGFLELKAILSSVDTSDDISAIKNSVDSILQDNRLNEIKERIEALNPEWKLNEIKEIISTLAQDDKLENLKNSVIEAIKISQESNDTQSFTQLEQILNDINYNEKASLDKLDELLKNLSQGNFSDTGKEISFLANDLEIILEEIKHSRSISDKSFSKMENIFENFNLNEIKSRLFEFENYLKKFLQKDDLQDFTRDLQAITDKFDLANGVIIEGFDDLESLKNHIIGFEVKFNDLSDGIQKIMDENQEKFDSAIEAFDNTYKIDEITHISNDIFGAVNESKEAILTSFYDSKEKIELLIKAMDTSYKFDEIQEAIKNKIDETSSKTAFEADNKHEELKVLSQNITQDVDYLKSSIIDIIRENQEKFDAVLASLDEKVNSQDIQDKLAFLIQTLEDKTQENETQDISNKLTDEINNSKYLVIDTIRESEIKLQEFIKTIDNADKIEDLKQITENLYGEIDRAKDTVLGTVKDNQDRFELMVKALDNSERLDEINDLNKTIYSELMGSKDALLSTIRNNQNKLEEALRLTDVTLKVTELEDLSNKIIEELRFTKEIIQNVGRSINPEVLKDLQSSVDNLKNSIDDVHNSVLAVDVKINNIADKTDVSLLGDLIKERHEQLEYLVRAYDPTADISAIKERIESLATPEEFDDLKEKLDSNRDVVYELRSVFEEKTQNLELVIKSMENADDISDLRQILINYETEQSNIKNAIEIIAKNTENSDEINDLRQLILSLDAQQREIQNAVESALHADNNSDDISYLKGLLSEIESEQKEIKNAIEYIGKNSDLSSIQQSIENIIPYQQFDSLGEKIDSGKEAIYELRSILDERAQNLELVVKSMENTDDINDLKQLLVNLQNEQHYIKGTIEAAIKGTSNDNDIQYLKGLLADIESEQKESKTILEKFINSNNSDGILNAIDSIGYKIDSVNEVKDDISNVSREIETIKGSLGEILSQNDISETIEYVSEIKNDISNVSENLLNLKQELSSLSTNKDLQEAIEQLENIHYSIKEGAGSRENIAQNISLLDDKLSEIKSSVDFSYDIKELLTNVQEDQLALKALVTSFEGTDEETISTIKNQIISSESAIKELIDATKAQDDLSQIKTQIDGITQQVIVQVMQVFDNISFEQETQEIKEYIDESHSSVKNMLSMFKTNIERLLDAPKPLYIEELQQDLVKIAQSLDDIGPEMSEYVNTITSLRVSLEELSKSKDTITLIEQNLHTAAVDIDEILRTIKQTSLQIDLLYTKAEAKEDYTKIKSILDNILTKQQEQNENSQKEDIKEGIDNVNLSINYISENLNSFLSEYRIFQDKLTDTTQNLEGMAHSFTQADSINSEYKKGVSESFKALKKDFSSVISTVDTLYTDMGKMTALTEKMVEVSAQDKTDILDDMRTIKEVIENSDLEKLKDNFSTIIFSINGFLNSVDEKFASIIENTKGAYDFTEENNEIAANIKASIVHLLEWTNTASRDFTKIQQSIDAFRETFDEIEGEIAQISEIKEILVDLDSAIASRVDEVFERQLQNKLDAQVLPEFELLEQKLDKKISQRLYSMGESSEKNKEEIIAQLSEETSSLKELINIIEQNLFSKIQTSIEKVLDKEVDLTPVLDKLSGEFALANDKIDEGLNKIDSELYQANVRLDDGLNSIAGVVSNLNSTLDDNLEKINKTVKNISFEDITSKIDDGLNAISKKVEEAELSKTIDKIDDEFSAMNKKLDVDFFDLNKRVVDEFNIIEEKLDSKTDSFLKNIEGSNKELSETISSLTGRIESKSDQVLNNVKDTLKDQKEYIYKTIESSSKQMTDDIGALTEKLSSKSESAINTIDGIKDEISQEFVQFTEEVEEKTQLILQNIEEANSKASQDLTQFASRLNTQSGLVLKNVEEAKEDIKELWVRLDQQSESLVKILNSTKTELNESLEQTSGNIEAQNDSVLNSIEAIKENLIKDITNSVEKITDKLDKQTATIQSIDDIKSSISQISKNQTNVSDNSEILKGIAQNKDTLNKIIDKIEAQIANISQIEKTKNSIKEELDQIVDNLDDQTGMVLKNLEQYQTSFETLTSALENNTADILNGIQSSKDELTTELVQLVEKIDSQSTAITTQDKKFKALEEKLNEQEQKIQTLDSKLDIIIEKLNTL